MKQPSLMIGRHNQLFHLRRISQTDHRRGRYVSNTQKTKIPLRRPWIPTSNWFFLDPNQISTLMLAEDRSEFSRD
jgi:hypothetical protein